MQKVKQWAITIATILFITSALILTSIAIERIMYHFNTESFAETKIAQITDNGYIDLYVDTETNVVYVRAVNGTLTPMVNSDGTPKLWSKK